MADLSPLERVSRLSLASTYRTPDVAHGTGTPELGRPELAGALGMVPIQLEGDVALALGTHSAVAWPSIAGLAHAPLLAHLRGLRCTQGLVAGARAARSQWVLHDAFYGLLGRRMDSVAQRAKRVRMRRVDYVVLHDEIAAWLQMLAANGARAGVERLRG